ncbi:hypothetical protein [Bdellovibrio sp. NC01]|uniref:hypothetical protein n=1 Tax=Bdellovibrio sp. NC01 TaxID=2220073 RepID=UPI00115A436B|nr:hypothetical protein [Bdellovibrio sp. NC01]QDK39440.1 hypothetical protein DOE51_18475 [Bdellovibrio sp. NC01]
MYKLFLSSLCAFSLVFAPAIGLATQVSSVPTTKNTGSAGVENGTTPTGTSAQPSVKDGSDQSGSGNSKASAINKLTGGIQVVTGGMMIRSGIAQNASCECGAGTPQIMMGTMLVGMGLTNIAQGGDHSGAAGSAGVTGFQTDGFGGLSGTGSGTENPYETLTSKDPTYTKVPDTLKSIEKQGVYDPKMGTFKVGDKTYKASDFSSQAAMAAAGFPSGMIAGAMDAMSEAEKKAYAKVDKIKIGAATAANGYEEGGGGGGAGFDNGASGGDGSSDYAGAGAGGRAGAGKFGLDRDPSSLAGMSKNYNGEPIGVAADSIFLMMSRRYKVKESQESFFSPGDIALQK